MFIFNRLNRVFILLITLAFLTGFNAHNKTKSSSLNTKKTPDLGVQSNLDEINQLNITIFPDGKNLPKGNGSVEEGEVIFKMKCAACHGANGNGGIIKVPLVGGENTLHTKKPIKTVGSYWPYATTLFDYVRRTMPYNAPQTLTNDEVYALCAYLLNKNNIIKHDVVMNKKTLAEVKMPNSQGFINSYLTKRKNSKQKQEIK